MLGSQHIMLLCTAVLVVVPVSAAIANDESGIEVLRFPKLIATRALLIKASEYLKLSGAEFERGDKAKDCSSLRLSIFFSEEWRRRLFPSELARTEFSAVANHAIPRLIEILREYCPGYVVLTSASRLAAIPQSTRATTTPPLSPSFLPPQQRVDESALLKPAIEASELQALEAEAQLSYRQQVDAEAALRRGGLHCSECLPAV
jgi:hypothetical protein